MQKMTLASNGGEAFDTEATKRPRSTDDPRQDSRVEFCPSKPNLKVISQPKISLHKITYCSGESVCERMIDLTNDAMAWSCKFPVAELETGKTLDDDNSIFVDAFFNEISELPRETHSV